MANGVRINNLNQATSLNDTDTITIIQNDENKKASISLFDKDGTYTQSVVNTIPDLITTSKANVETTKQAIDEKFGYDEFSAQIVTSQAISSVGVSDDGSVDVNSQVQDGFMESAILYGKTQYHDTTADVYYDNMPEDTTGMTLELVSVKMPISTTTGKNLFDLELTQGAHGYGAAGIKPNFSGSSNRVTNLTGTYIKVNPNTKITFSILNNIDFAIAELDINGHTLGDTGWVGYTTIKPNHTITTKEKTSYIGFNFRKFDNSNITVQEVLDSNPMLEISGTATTYEPYKSSILSCNEEVELRGIGDVQDTLDLMTGEVTERIGEIVLDGSNDELISIYKPTDNNTMAFSVRNMLPNGWYQRKIICDKLSKINSVINDVEGFSHGDSDPTLYIRINKSKLTSLDITGFRNYLSSNPLTFDYQLATESIKTVGLNSSNGDVKTPVIYKNGHILLQSNGLIPELYYSIPVSYSGLIAQNTMTNLKHSWRLDELEIMAYTSIVNSQYESLILVATAETNEVVVSSEYVPDESLYNMLKVLVNANALVNADEKINVFYLYGKLSDEMYIDLIIGDDMQ